MLDVLPRIGFFKKEVDEDGMNRRSNQICLQHYPDFKCLSEPREVFVFTLLKEADCISGQMSEPESPPGG